MKLWWEKAGHWSMVRGRARALRKAWDFECEFESLLAMRAWVCYLSFLCEIRVTLLYYFMVLLGELNFQYSSRHRIRVTDVNHCSRGVGLELGYVRFRQANWSKLSADI